MARLCWGVGKARGGGGFRAVLSHLKHAARLHMGISKSGIKIMDRGHTGIRPVQQRKPFRLAPRLEHRGTARPQIGPACGVRLRVKSGVGQPGFLPQERIEFRLNRADAQPFSIGAFIAAIEMRPTVKRVGLPLCRPCTLPDHAPDHRAQMGGAIDNGRVNHLPAPGFAHLMEGGQNAHGQIHRPAPEIAQEVQGRHRSVLSDCMKRTREADIVDVMPCILRARAGLAPAGHPAIDQRGIAGVGVLGTKA